MKQCKNCKSIYADDLSFCLQDGTPLAHIVEDVDPMARTEVIYDTARAKPTEILPSAMRSEPTAVLPNAVTSPPIQPTPYREPPARNSASKLPYVLIGFLLLACGGLAAALVILNLDRIFPKKDDAAVSLANNAKSPPLPSPSATNTRIAANAATTPTPKTMTLTATISPTGKWKGDWSTTTGTLLDIEITLNDTNNNGLDGQIKWTLRKTARPDKTDKIGLSATEFVRGTFDPAAGAIKMSGYRKDDPDTVLVMLDDYKLTISPDGKSLTGLARNGGKWNGHLRLTR